ncbi:MAG: hypothetical protein ACJ76Z_10785 [Thermoleophilaceae bacterium]
MPTRIIFSNGDAVTVSDAIETVADRLGAGGLAKLDRPWGDTSIYVNASEVLYVEAQDERNPDIEALEAAEPAPIAAAPPAAGGPAPGGPAPGAPGGPPVQPPPR